MFELEAAIDSWKQSFGKDDDVSLVESLELEEHLRELISDLVKSGLSHREAFMVGADRLGHPSELEREYAKVNATTRWRRRVFWMLTGYIVMIAAGALVSAVVAITGAGMAISGAGGILSAGVMIAVMALGWIGLPMLAYRHFMNRGDSGGHFPAGWFAAAGAILVIAPIVTAGAKAAQVRIVDISWQAESTMYLGMGGFAIHFFVVALCFIAICKFNKAVPVMDGVLMEGNVHDNGD